MNILITGGAGFVGSNLSKSLLGDGHHIHAIDNLSTGKIENLPIEGRMKYSNLDLSDSNNINLIENIVAWSDVVYHLAASVGVGLIKRDPSKALQNSTKINEILFPLFEKYKKKVIFSSTSEVYGETTNSNGSKESDKLVLPSPHTPRGGYACSKLMAEFLMRSYTFPGVIVRFFNIVGSSQLPDYGHVLPRFVNSAKEGRDLLVYGDGNQVRSFCDIRDAVEMLKLLIDDRHNNEIYNIGNDTNRCTINELAEICIKINKSNSSIQHIDLKDALGDNSGEIFVRFPNTEKIKKYYKCKYKIVDIIKSI